MANSLLDFVMSVVRDPDVAARYAADPAQTIADANLTDVSAVDVNNLIPVVAESLSPAMPTRGSGWDRRRPRWQRMGQRGGDCCVRRVRFLRRPPVDQDQPVVNDVGGLDAVGSEDQWGHAVDTLSDDQLHHQDDHGMDFFT